MLPRFEIFGTGAYCVVVVCVLVMAGCKQEVGQVSGTVVAINPNSHEHEPIQFGRITFYHSESKIAAHGAIKNGNFTASDLQIGKTKVTVSSFDLAFQEKGSIEGFDDAGHNKVAFEPGKYFAIHPKYRSLNDTPLEFDIQPGEQKLELQLTDLPTR